jgi:hypothetical protein
MFGSATFLTPQYWVSQPNKHTQEPHHQRKFWDLFVVRYLITAVYLYLCLCFGHFSAAALASAPQGGDSFQLLPESSFSMFYRILQQAMRSITISNTIRNQNTW